MMLKKLGLRVFFESQISSKMHNLIGFSVEPGLHLLETRVQGLNCDNGDHNRIELFSYENKPNQKLRKYVFEVRRLINIKRNKKKAKKMTTDTYDSSAVKIC